MKAGNNNHRRQLTPPLAVMAIVILAILPTSNFAFGFTASGNHMSTKTKGRQTELIPISSSLNSFVETPNPIFASLETVVETPNAITPSAEHPLVTAELQNADTQSRSFDRNAVINTSILAIAIIAVLHQILSVDIGITQGWSPEEIAYRIPLDIWNSYTSILNIAPLQTKAVTSATVYTIGDIIAQSKGGVTIGKLDRGRIGRSLVAGLIGHGPMSHVWYHLSEDFFDNVLQLHAWWDFVPKIVVDQTLFGPIWNNSYILLLGLMQFQKPSQIWSDMKRTTIPLIISGLKLWPFVHIITYGLIPVENRLLWVDAIEIIWVTILASEASGANDDDLVSASSDDVDESLVLDKRVNEEVFR